MVTELLLILILFIVGIVVVIFGLAGIDYAFNVGAPAGYGKLLGLNTLVLLAGGLCWFAVFMLTSKADNTISRLIPNETVITGLVIALSLAAMFLTKYLLLGKFGLTLKYPSLVVIGGLLITTIPPWLAYLALRAFGQAFKN